MQDFLAAIGLVLVIEGLVYGGFPGLARQLAGEVLSMPENALRIAGLAAIAIGVGIVWLVRAMTVDRFSLVGKRRIYPLPVVIAANVPYFLPTWRDAALCRSALLFQNTGRLLDDIQHPFARGTADVHRRRGGTSCRRRRRPVAS